MRSNAKADGRKPPLLRSRLVSLSDYLNPASGECTAEFRQLTDSQFEARCDERQQVETWDDGAVRDGSTVASTEGIGDK